MRSKIVGIIERYLGRVHHSGEDNVSLRCPFHKGGQETKPSFSINVTNGVFWCFTCHATGPFPKLLRSLGLPSSTIDAELADIRGELDASRREREQQKVDKWKTHDPFLAETILPETVIKPYEWCPVKLINLGFSSEWLQWMDIGYDRVNNRITFPVRDIYGNLAGVSGGAAIAGQEPKYKVYRGRRIHPTTGLVTPSDYGEWFDDLYPNYQFHNHHYLWNFDTVYPKILFGKQEDLIVVEGYKACLWMLQNGYHNTVALMGSSMSEWQRNLLHRVSANIILFLDNDEAGRDGTNKIARELRLFQPGVLIAQYPADARQPDDIAPEDLAASIQGAENYPQWIRRTGYVDGRSTQGRTKHQ
jgi:DNA primase